MEDHKSPTATAMEFILGQAGGLEAGSGVPERLQLNFGQWELLRELFFLKPGHGGRMVVRVTFVCQRDDKADMKENPHSK